MHDMPLDVIWTTNYDRVIESAYQCINPTKDVDHKYNAEDIHRSRPGHISLYKMHGDINHKSTIIITKKDYDNYLDNHALFIHHLNYHLTNRVFLFLGFGFTDPNVNHILSRLKRMGGGQAKTHYMILLSNLEKDQDRINRNLWIKELRHFEIETLIVNSRDELVGVLQEIVNRIRLLNVAVCGSSTNINTEEVSKSIGKMLMEEGEGYNLYTCFAKGVGRSCIEGALEHFANNLPVDIEPYKKIKLWPVNSSFETINEDQRNLFREGMIRDVGACIFISGKNGTELEYKIARDLKRFIIPLGFTEGTAKKIWDECKEKTDDLLDLYTVTNEHKREIKQLIFKLGEKDKTDVIVNHVRRILNILSRQSN